MCYTSLLFIYSLFLLNVVTDGINGFTISDRIKQGRLVYHQISVYRNGCFVVWLHYLCTSYTGVNIVSYDLLPFPTSLLSFLFLSLIPLFPSYFLPHFPFPLFPIPLTPQFLIPSFPHFPASIFSAPYFPAPTPTPHCSGSLFLFPLSLFLIYMFPLSLFPLSLFPISLSSIFCAFLLIEKIKQW